jgi:hypothetical protein
VRTRRGDGGAADRVPPRSAALPAAGRRSKKKAGGGSQDQAQPARQSRKLLIPTAAPTGDAGEAVVKLMEAARTLGKEQAKRILDLMG